MKYLITGASGFVGAHLVRYLNLKGHHIEGIDLCPPPKDADYLKSMNFTSMSLMDYGSLEKLLWRYKPQRIIHLASASSVAASWKTPIECFVNNTNIFLNLVEAIRQTRLKCRVLSIGSSEEYGIMPSSGKPATEDYAIDPLSPYAVARVAQEQLSKVYAQGYGLDIVCTRSFNHIGPGQSDRFVVSSLIRQAVAVKFRKQKSISCGSLDIVRDFMDVRDVVKAYDLILQKGKTGEVFNVCSSKAVALKKILQYVCARLELPMEFKVDKSLVRPIDNKIIVGSNKKLLKLGFKPGYGLEQSLDDMIAWWQNFFIAQK